MVMIFSMIRTDTSFIDYKLTKETIYDFIGPINIL